MKQEYYKQTQHIQKLENKIEKLQHSQVTSQQVIDLKLDIQKLQFKLKKQTDRFQLSEK